MPEHETHRDLRSMTVEQAMRAAAPGAAAGDTVLYPDQSLDLAMLALGRHSLREAPVVSREHPRQVVGMLSLEDISAALRAA
jgi:hypothetical protein